MTFRIFRRPSPPDSGAVPAEEEAALQRSLLELETRLEGLKAERAALERLAALRPGGVEAEDFEAVERELGPWYSGPGWDALKAWFRGRP